jgi:multicomponent Na+:H+ antiporter subunit G
VIGQVLALLGALLTLLAAIGVLRFRDVLARMHALTKASTLGFVLVALGAALELRTLNDTTSALLAAGLQLITLPVAANLIARSTYLAEGIPLQVDTIDELADARRAAEEAVRRRRTSSDGERPDDHSARDEPPPT